MPSKVIIRCAQEGITLEEALNRLPKQTSGLYITIDVTGLDEEIQKDVGIFTPSSADSPRLNLNPQEHRTWGIDFPLNIRAVPTLCVALENASVISDPLHNMLSIAESGASWATNEHKDRFLVGAAIRHSSGGFIPPHSMPIVANTSDTLFLAGSHLPIPPLEILEPAARFRFGEESLVPFAPNLHVVARGGLGVQWIRWGKSSIAHAGSIGVALSPQTGSLIQWSANCFDGGLRVGDGGSIDIDEAVFNDCTVALEGFGRNERNFRRIAATNTYFAGHRGDYYGLDLRLRSCAPFGTQITTNYSGYCDLENVEILNGTGDGLRFWGGSNQHRLRNAVIDNCEGNAVSLRNTHLIMQEVHGVGSKGAGLFAAEDAHAKIVGDASVRGTTEIDGMGSLENRSWSEIPLAEFSEQAAARIYR